MKTGYHTLKDEHLAAREDVISANYVEVLEAFKSTDNAEDFVRKAIPGLLL